MKIQIFYEKNIIKKIVYLKHIYGLSYYNETLYLSNVFKNFINKLSLKNNYYQEKISQFNFKYNFFNLFKYDDFYGIHSIDFMDRYRLILLSYLRKKIFIYNLKKKQKTIISKFDNLLVGPSHILYDKIKKILFICDYEGKEVYLYSFKNLSVKKMSDIGRIKFKKPHMTCLYKSNYYILDTKLSKILIFNKYYNLIDTISKKNVILENRFNLKDFFFEKIVSIKIDNLGNKYISDVGKNNCIYVINKKNRVIGLIKKNEIIKNNTKYYLKNLDLDRVYDISLIKKDIFIASTHTNKIIQIKNLFLYND